MTNGEQTAILHPQGMYPVDLIWTGRIAGARSMEMAEPLVLIVDEGRRLADVLHATLRNVGYQVTSATQREVVATARLLRPALILLDMPRLDPVSVSITRQLREHPRTTTIPIIALVATMDLDQYPGLVADELLRRPFRLSELCAAVARWAKPGA